MTGKAKAPGGRAKYDVATKAAVMAALLAGQGTDEVARAYNIPSGTIKAWRIRTKGEKTAPTVAEVATVATSKKEEIGALILGYLRENLITLKTQNVVFSDIAWLKTQNAESLAVLHGVLSDKTIRLLEAMSGAGLEP